MVNVNDLKKMFENSSQGKKSTSQLMTPKKLENSNITSPLELNKPGNSEIKKSEKNNELLPGTKMEITNIEFKNSNIYIYGKEIESISQTPINIYNGV
ncbi:hypothetical protein [Photorhabdus sp. RM71S]|uniref:hypothetical protein n=1 Tax=Photorhabdus sp. RM71S TaxID=3342824 RepID=UPI0036DBCDED